MSSRPTRKRKPDSSRRLFQTPKRSRYSSVATRVMPVLRREPRMTTVVRGRGPVAEKTIVRLKYNQTFISDGTLLDYRFNLNSLYDPDLTSTGHQPYGYDTYATLYNRYRVFKVKAYIGSCTNVSTSVINFTAMANNLTTTQTNPSLAAEKPGAINKVLTYNQPVFIKRTFHLPSVCGVSPQTYASDDRYQAQFGFSPAENLVLHICSSNMATDGAVTGSTQFTNITFIFYCEVFDAIDLGQS